jgi:hypothetical protein
MTPLESLRKNIGRAYVQAHFSQVGRDYAYYLKSTSRAQHLYVPAFEKPPPELMSEMGSLTGGLVDFAFTTESAEFPWATSHLRNLPERWESNVERSIIESHVVGVATACDWFVDEMTGGKDKRKFLEGFPAHAAEHREMRATRNCLVHNAGVVDGRYLSEAGASNRAEIGQTLPLNWTYAYSVTLSVLRFGVEACA